MLLLIFRPCGDRIRIVVLVGHDVRLWEFLGDSLGQVRVLTGVDLQGRVVVFCRVHGYLRYPNLDSQAPGSDKRFIQGNRRGINSTRVARDGGRARRPFADGRVKRERLALTESLAD